MGTLRLAFGVPVHPCAELARLQAQEDIWCLHAFAMPAARVPQARSAARMDGAIRKG